MEFECYQSHNSKVEQSLSNGNADDTWVRHFTRRFFINAANRSGIVVSVCFPFLTTGDRIGGDDDPFGQFHNGNAMGRWSPKRQKKTLVDGRTDDEKQMIRRRRRSPQCSGGDQRAFSPAHNMIHHQHDLYVYPQSCLEVALSPFKGMKNKDHI